MNKLSVFLAIVILTSQFALHSQTQIGLDIDGQAAGDESGIPAISNDGSFVAIGGLYNDNNGNQSGHVRVYQYDGANWIQRGQDIDGEASEDDSGGAVSLNSDGSVLAIGARSNDGNGADSGHVRVYDLSAVLSVDEISNELNITLYPNPANDYVNISGATSELSLRIYDVLGKQVLSKKVTNRIDVWVLMAGTYYVILSDENKTSTYKLMKN